MRKKWFLKNSKIHTWNACFFVNFSKTKTSRRKLFIYVKFLFFVDFWSQWFLESLNEKKPEIPRKIWRKFVIFASSRQFSATLPVFYSISHFSHFSADKKKLEIAKLSSGSSSEKKAEKRKVPVDIQSDPTKSDTYKNMFTTCEAAKKKKEGHWVTYNPLYYWFLAKIGKSRKNQLIMVIICTAEKNSIFVHLLFFFWKISKFFGFLDFSKFFPLDDSANKQDIFNFFLPFFCGFSGFSPGFTDLFFSVLMSKLIFFSEIFKKNWIFFEKSEDLKFLKKRGFLKFLNFKKKNFFSDIFLNFFCFSKNRGNWKKSQFWILWN